MITISDLSINLKRKLTVINPYSSIAQCGSWDATQEALWSQMIAGSILGVNLYPFL